jgi:hypothetical protein
MLGIGERVANKITAPLGQHDFGYAFDRVLLIGREGRMTKPDNLNQGILVPADRP